VSSYFQANINSQFRCYFRHRPNPAPVVDLTKNCSNAHCGTSVASSDAEVNLLQRRRSPQLWGGLTVLGRLLWNSRIALGSRWWRFVRPRVWSPHSVWPFSWPAPAWLSLSDT